MMTNVMNIDEDVPASLPLSVERCDPGQIIKAALMTHETISSEDVFILWAMRLPLEIDAADAAALLLHAYRDVASDNQTQVRLREILAEACLYPTAHLDQFAAAQSEPQQA